MKKPDFTFKSTPLKGPYAWATIVLFCGFMGFNFVAQLPLAYDTSPTLEKYNPLIVGFLGCLLGLGSYLVLTAFWKSNLGNERRYTYELSGTRLLAWGWTSIAILILAAFPLSIYIIALHLTFATASFVRVHFMKKQLKRAVKVVEGYAALDTELRSLGG